MKSLIHKSSVSKGLKLVPLDETAGLPKSLKAKDGLAFPKEFKAGVVVDKTGAPKYFVFDSRSLWDMLCVFDEKYESVAPAEEYISKSKNPLGTLIDHIEAALPLNPKFIGKLENGVKEARISGFVSLKEVVRKLKSF